MDAFKFFQKKPNVISQIINFFLCITLYYDKIIDKCFYKNILVATVATVVMTKLLVYQFIIEGLIYLVGITRVLVYSYQMCLSCRM